MLEHFPQLPLVKWKCIHRWSQIADSWNWVPNGNEGQYNTKFGMVDLACDGWHIVHKMALGSASRQIWKDDRRGGLCMVEPPPFPAGGEAAKKPTYKVDELSMQRIDQTTPSWQPMTKMFYQSSYDKQTGDKWIDRHICFGASWDWRRWHGLNRQRKRMGNMDLLVLDCPCGAQRADRRHFIWDCPCYGISHAVEAPTCQIEEALCLRLVDLERLPPRRTALEAPDSMVEHFKLVAQHLGDHFLTATDGGADFPGKDVPCKHFSLQRASWSVTTQQIDDESEDVLLCTPQNWHQLMCGVDQGIYTAEAHSGHSRPQCCEKG